MAKDTGAPWTIPYPDTTDLADDPAQSKARAERIAANLTTVDSGAVHKTGAETVAGAKTLTSSLTINPASPTDGTIALYLGLERAWQFHQSGIAANANLNLKALSDKTFNVIGTGVTPSLAVDTAFNAVRLGGKNGIQQATVCGRNTTAGPPQTGAWLANDTVFDSYGLLWTCVTGGTPGTWYSAGIPSFPSVAARDAALISPMKGQVIFRSDLSRQEMYYVVSGFTGWGPVPGQWILRPSGGTATVVANATWTPLNLDPAIITHGTWTAPGTWTCQLPGTYYFSVGATFPPNATGYRAITLYQNGAARNFSTRTVSACSTAVEQTVASDHIWVNPAAGDTFQAYVFQNSGGSLTTLTSGPNNASMRIQYAGQ